MSAEYKNGKHGILFMYYVYSVHCCQFMFNVRPNYDWHNNFCSGVKLIE